MDSGIEVESEDVESELGRPATGGELGVVPTLEETGSEEMGSEDAGFGDAGFGDTGFGDEGSNDGAASSGASFADRAGDSCGDGDDRDGGEGAAGDAAEAWISAAPDERIVGAWVSSGGNWPGDGLGNWKGFGANPCGKL